jgi:hypothetical protein
MRTLTTILFSIACIAAVPYIAEYWSVHGRDFMGGFTEEDIANVKEHIKDDFNQRPFIHVTEVRMIRESSHKLIGFVKMKQDYQSGILMQNCSATLGDSNEYIYECKQ